jgi:hypothetical protein
MGTRQPPSDHGLEVTCNSCKQLRRLPWVFESVPSSEAHQRFDLKMKSGFVLEKESNNRHHRVTIVKIGYIDFVHSPRLG